MTSPPHIVAIVGNDITIDSRVKKTAAAAAAAGYRSTIVCYTAERSRQDTTMGQVRVVKVPVPFAVRNGPGRTPRPIRPFVGTELAERRLAKRTRQLAIKRRKLARDEAGAGLLILRLDLKVRQELYRIRTRGHVAWDRLKRAMLRFRSRSRNRLTMRANNPADAVFDYEMAFGPLIEELEPDLIHAHDFHMIGVAVTAAKNLRRVGRTTKVIYDAHELVEGLSYDPRVVTDWLDEEGSHIHSVDAVVGVSPHQVRRLVEKYSLEREPVVTLNAPVTDPATRPTTTIRDDVDVQGRLLVYHGNATPQRGVFVLVDALAYLPEDVHIVFVLQGDHPLISELGAVAEAADTNGRLHFVDFVEASHLPTYLSTADLAVIPYLLTGNHDKTLPNKLFEALQAGLPVLASDMEALGGFVLQHGVGAIFEQGSARSLAEAATSMLNDIETFRGHITREVREMSGWDAQAAKLVQLYAELIGGISDRPIHVSAEDVTEDAAARAKGPTRLAVGPRNMAGQAYLIATAVQARLGIPALSFAIERDGLQFPIHRNIPTAVWRDPTWQLRQREDLRAGFTHVLAESGTGVLGSLNGGFIDEQLPLLREDGLEVGVVFHGSELRDPRRHSQRPYSPYAVDDELTRSLEQATARLRAHLANLDIPVFVTTPDLLQDIDGTWLPVVIEYAKWSSAVEPFTREVPTVLHLPSRSRLKGSEHVDSVAYALAEEGLIEYLRPTEHVSPAEVLSLIEQADIVIDGIVIGAYGVMSCQTLAAGRISIANLSELGKLESECPIVNADPGTLDSALHELLANRETWHQLSEAGRDYVTRYHDGAYTARTLQSFLGLDAAT